MAEVNPRVNIVLPIHNGAKYMRQSIDSCLNQTYKNIELIIVNDCSTDETQEIVQSYSDPRIKYVRHEANKGLPTTLNTGFANSTGEYFTWTSDDNYYAEDAIEKMLSFLINKKCHFVYCNFCWFNEEKPLKLHFTRLPNILNLKDRNDLGACFLYSREVKESIGDYDINAECAEDYDYWIRVSKKFKICHLDENLYYYRQHRKTLSISRFYEVRIVSILVRIKNDMLDLDNALSEIVEIITMKHFAYIRVKRFAKIMTTIIYSNKINKILNDFHHGKISFKEAKISLNNIVGH